MDDRLPRPRTIVRPGRSDHRDRRTCARQRSSRVRNELLFRRDLSHRPSTARDPISDTQLVRVTHPFHPLRGQEFVLLERRCAWGEERVYFHDVSGRLRRLPASWTSVSAPDPFEVLSEGRSTFRVEDLLHLVGLIARHREISATAGTKSVKRKSSRK
ncbi:DUF5372 family protein [Paraburkholderia sp. EG287B]|uniref:DUF5372 family protein n=1 Tax=unclassified Paraburkholderia TaxID=2615204 RepID=UPI0034D359E1